MNPKTKGVTTLLILNIAIFAIGYIKPELYNWIHVHFRLFFPMNENFAAWQFISHMFLHGSPSHILFNMFALFSFGTVLEQIWGTKKFIVFYLISGLGAALIYTLINYVEFNSIYAELIEFGLNEKQILSLASNGLTIQGFATEELVNISNIFRTSMLGASGAIYGVLVAFGITFPNAKLSLMFIPVPIAAKVLIPIILLIDLFSGITGFSLFGGGIAHFAHIGGAIIGFLLMLFFNKNKKTSKFHVQDLS